MRLKLLIYIKVLMFHQYYVKLEHIYNYTNLNKVKNVAQNEITQMSVKYKIFLELHQNYN